MMGVNYLTLELVGLTTTLLLLAIFRNLILPHWKVLLALMIYGLATGFVWDSLIFHRVYTLDPKILLGTYLGPLPIEEYLLFLIWPLMVGAVTLVLTQKHDFK
jgi:lycopene cyclase domain-containing protein